MKTLAILIWLAGAGVAIAGSSYYPDAYGGGPDYGHDAHQRMMDQQEQQQLQQEQLDIERQQLEEMRQQTRELQQQRGGCTGAFC